MILIFKGFLDKASSLFKTKNTNRKKIKYVSYVALFCGLIFTAFACAKVTVGFNVNYLGEDIAIVENREVIDKAISIATESVADKSAEKEIKTPTLKLTLTVADKFDNAASIADSIIENTSNIVDAYALKINGETVAFYEENVFSELLENRRTAYYIEDAKNEAEFIDEIEIEQGLYLKSKLTSLKNVKKAIKKLDVQTVSYIETDITIPYKTVKKTTDEKDAGFSEVTTTGCNGVSVSTEKVKSLNGKVKTRKEVSFEVKSKAVDEVILIGTGVKKSAKKNAGFIFPIAKGQYYISSYFGDGRNHKAIDICADRGTAFYAVGGGTVTYAGYDGDFGYNVIIQHGNGIKTRYAHANSLSVKSGQIVSQGDIIGSVGSTGWSTGNHLHFEVILNGARVDPMPYIS